MNKSLQQFQRWGEALDYTSHFCADTFLSALFSISDFSCWIKLYLFRGHSHTSEDIPVQNKCINQVIWYNKLAISYIEIISEVGKGQPNLKRNKTQVKILYMEKKKRVSNLFYISDGTLYPTLLFFNEMRQRSDLT